MGAATKTVTPLLDVPQSITVVTEQQIKELLDPVKLTNLDRNNYQQSR